MPKSRFSFSSRIASFKYAINGLKILFTEEVNSKIQLASTCIVIMIGFLFHLNAYEWIEIIFAIFIVVITEAINTSIENLCNAVTMEQNDQIKKVKDIAAGAVLMSAITAVIIGLIVFLPKMIK